MCPGKSWGLWTLGSVDVHREAGCLENQRPLGACHAAGIRARKWALREGSSPGSGAGCKLRSPCSRVCRAAGCLPSTRHPIQEVRIVPTLQMRTLIFGEPGDQPAAPGAPTVPLGRAPKGQGPLRADALLVQRWHQDPRVPERAKGDLLPCVCLREALPSRRFLPSPLSSGPSSHISEVHGDTRTYQGPRNTSWWFFLECLGVGRGC